MDSRDSIKLIPKYLTYQVILFILYQCIFSGHNAWLPIFVCEDHILSKSSFAA